jgi:hypothetical protein
MSGRRALCTPPQETQPTRPTLIPPTKFKLIQPDGSSD